MGNATTERLGRSPAERHAADYMLNAGPGWYFDPDDEAIYRFWDGLSWTEHRSYTALSSVPD